MAPLILVTNDDGIDSPYLGGLVEGLEALGADVVVAAPERERSAASQAITLHKPLRINEVEPGRYAISGTPVDCAYLGLLKLCSRPPDLCVSGINRGYNLGADVFYSGTVAAAVEAGLRDIQAIAVSLAPGRSSDIAGATEFATALAKSALDHPLPHRTILNVNVPPQPDGRYRWTHLGDRVYEDLVEERHDPRGRPYYWIGGGPTPVSNEPGSDCHAVEESIISVTPLRLDLTAHDVIDDAPAWTVTGYDLVPGEEQAQ
jgi:5'-nucleotidase